MANRTITALFDTRNDAEDAKQRLLAVGLSSGSIDIHDEGSVSSTPKSTAASSASQGGGMLAGIKNLFGSHEDTHTYVEGLSRGHFLLTAKVDNDDVDEAIQVLETSRAVDFDKKQTEWKSAGWTAPAAGFAATGAGTGATTGAADDSIKIVEEQLVVGKREVDRGGVRVRSYIVETPVSEQVTLRDEVVDVERRPVNRVMTAADNAFQERTIEMRETGEEAVVAKQAIVKEELVIRKDVGQRTEEVRDTVRHTEVDVERVDSTTKTSDIGAKRI